jgi:hypothetical protein
MTMSFSDLFIPEHKTNVLPLRWLANYVFHPISMWFFKIGLRYNDKIEYDSQYKWHNHFLESFGWKTYQLFDIPYSKWGTTYVMSVDLKEIMDMPGAEWSDYDENGHPYWLYTEWQEDPETGDAWRLIRKD